MTRAKVYEAIIDKSSYDIKSACRNFYEFQDDSRLYYTLDRLVMEEDREVLRDYVSNMREESFMIRLLCKGGGVIKCLVCLEKANAAGQVCLKMTDIDSLFLSEEALAGECRFNEKLLELYGDDVFIYNPKTESVVIKSTGILKKKDICMPLDEAEKHMKAMIVPEKEADVEDLIHAVRQGRRYFEGCIDGDILDGKEDVKKSIVKGGAVYDEGDWLASVGYIHRGVEVSLSNNKKTEIDSLTGLLSKGEITNLAIRAIDVEKRNASVAILDVDYFKKINDTYGHMAGDETLKAVAGIIATQVGDSGVVGRIGGDEFFILFYDTDDMEEAREHLRSIKNMISAHFPVNNENKPAITVSIGCAGYPKDGDNYEDIFSLADFALYRAKAKGRNRYIIYDKEKHGSLNEIQKVSNLSTRINSRGNLTCGDILCVIMDRVLGDDLYPLERLLDDFIENFEPERIAIYNAGTGKVLHMVGAKVPSNKVIKETQEYILGSFWQKKYVYDDVVVNDISIIEGSDPDVYEKMQKQGIISCIHVKFHDRQGNLCILSLEAVTRRIVWNSDHLHYYRLMGKILSEFIIA